MAGYVLEAELCRELLDESEWVGGCGKTFSRRDALARHIKNFSGGFLNDFYT